MNIKNTIRRAAEAQARHDSEALPRAAIKRVRSTNELRGEYHQPGYGLYFCFHNKTYYEPCTTSERTTRDAFINIQNAL